MKKTDYLILTCTGTPEGKDVSKADIIGLHTQPVALGGHGWNRPGIDYLVTLDGRLETIIPEDSPNEVDLWGISKGTQAMTGTARYLAYAGGKTAKATKDKDTRTQDQKDSLAAVVQFFVRKFPKLLVLGMNQVPAKDGDPSPCFDVAEWCAEIGVPEENIFKGV